MMRGLSSPLSPLSSGISSPPLDSIDSSTSSIQDIEIGSLPYIATPLAVPRIGSSTASFDDDSKSYTSSLEKSIQDGFSKSIQAIRRQESFSLVERYLKGPAEVPSVPMRPFLPKLELFLDRIFSPIYRRVWTLPLFIIAWFLGFLFLVRSSYFTSSTSSGTTVNFIGSTASFWIKNDGCGLNGSGCLPFANSSLSFRCPAGATSVELLNFYNVGVDEIIFKPLVVGGFDELNTYRADSWICAAAVQQGLITDARGGCGVLNQIGSFENFVGGSGNRVDSDSFDSIFPSAYRFDKSVSASHCSDLRNDILAYQVVLSFLFSFVFRPSPIVFFWTLLLLGFWTIVLVTDSRSFPPDLSSGFKFFLPTLFVGHWIWLVAFSAVSMRGLSVERTIYYLGPFWVGVLLNLSLSWIPVDQLTTASINRRPGGLIAVLIIAGIVLLIVLNQLRVIRREGKLLQFIKWYALAGAVMGILCALPGLEFRFHHYIAALVLLPGTAFKTRTSAFLQAFLLGIFLNGVARWGYDTILATTTSLVGDGTLGTDIPTFLTVNQSSVNWNSIPATLTTSWDGFALIIDDVLQFTGNGTNFTLPLLDSSFSHYFRIAYTLTGNSGDFSKAGELLGNGSFIAPGIGAGG